MRLSVTFITLGLVCSEDSTNLAPEDTILESLVPHGWIAQMVERHTSYLMVVGSNPTPTEVFATSVSEVFASVNTPYID